VFSKQKITVEACCNLFFTKTPTYFFYPTEYTVRQRNWAVLGILMNYLVLLPNTVVGPPGRPCLRMAVDRIVAGLLVPEQLGQDGAGLNHNVLLILYRGGNEGGKQLRSTAMEACPPYGAASPFSAVTMNYELYN
jgi:hypothetical protein